MSRDDVSALDGCLTSAAGAVALVDAFPNALAAEVDVEAVVAGELLLLGFDDLISESVRARLDSWLEDVRP